MQVSNPSGTLPPWLSSSWLNAMPAYNELLRREIQRDHTRYREHLQPAPGLTLYAYGPYGRNPQPIFRFGGFPGVNGVRPGTGSGGADAVAGGWDRYPLHQFDPLFAHTAGDLSRIPGVLVRGAHSPVNVEWDASGAPAGTSTGHGGSPAVPGGFTLSPRATLRAWLFGTALVVLVVVLVRAIDKCLDLNLLKSRRRSQEWPTPSVRATNHQTIDNSVIIMPQEEYELRPVDCSEAISVDLPPPYSECLRDEQIPDPGGPKLNYEEPPPDYNDTFVKFSNKNGVSSVLIYSRRRTPILNRREIPGSSANNDNSTSEEQNAQNVEEVNTSNAVANQNETANSNPDTYDVQVISYVVRDMAECSAETAEAESNEECDHSETRITETNEERTLVV